MGLSSAQYRLRFQSIARFVDWKPPKRLGAGDKAKITRYANRIGKALAKGYQPVKAKNDGRIEAAHRVQGIKGMPGLKVAFIRAPGNGFRAAINRDGSIRSTNKASGISKVTIAAIFIDPETDDAEEHVELEAKRLIRAATAALGHRPQRCTIAYWGGENAWGDLSQLPDMLYLPTSGTSSTPGKFPADGVSFYWVKRSKQILKVQQRLRDERSAAADRRADRRRRSDV
jgi:hypothetical protein